MGPNEESCEMEMKESSCEREADPTSNGRNSPKHYALSPKSIVLAPVIRKKKKQGRERGGGYPLYQEHFISQRKMI